MNMMRIAPPMLAVFLAAGLLLSDEEPKTISLFDGKTFAGWEGNLDVFLIEKERSSAEALDIPSSGTSSFPSLVGSSGRCLFWLTGTMGGGVVGGLTWHSVAGSSPLGAFDCRCSL